MDSSLIVRPARVQDVKPMARVHVRCWQETYRGLMPDAVLGTARFDDGVREIRMVRSVQHGGTGRSHCL